MVKRYIENTVDPRPYTGERLRAADFGRGGEMIGEAVQGFGQQIGRATDVLAEIGEKYDEAAVRKADAEDALEISRIKQQALSAEGIDAQGAVEQARKDIEEVGRRRQESFSNNRQRTMYSDIFSRRQLGAVETLGEHSYKQVEVARKASIGASIESGTRIAIDSHDDPVEFDRNMAAVEQGVRELNKGMPADAVNNAIAKVRSSVHAGVVEQLLSDPDKATDAAIYLKDHAAEITPDDETKLWKQVNPIVDEERTLSDASWAMSGAPMPDGTEIDTPTDDPEPTTDPLAPVPVAKTSTPAPQVKGFVNPLGRGVGRISNTAAQHRARGSKNAVDIAAPAGTPIRPPMSGEVLMSGWTKDGGWSVTIKHPNGYVTGYAHMRAKSALEPGDPVDNPTIIGGVGNTGEKSHGNHLHYTVRKGVGQPKVDPQTVEWDAGTVDPASANWKEAALPQYKAEDTNIESALGRLHARATAENWSARRYEKAASEIRQRGAVQQSLYNQNQQRLFDNAAAAMAAAEVEGKPITTRAQVPNYGQLDDSGRARIDNAIAANKKSLVEGGVKANGDTYTTLAVAAVDPSMRDEFLSTNLDVVTDITPGERTRLKLKPAALRNDERGVLAANLDRINTYVGRYSDEGGFGTPAKRGTDTDKENRRKRGMLFDRTSALVDQRQKQLGRPLTDPELDGIVRSQVVAIVRDGGNVPLYLSRTMPKKPGEVTGVANWQEAYQNIPPIVLSSIKAGFARRGVTHPSYKQIMEVYLEGSR
jgi:murein DD-endopeptidase MepM/ murein hydrolase activator NlpD